VRFVRSLRGFCILRPRRTLSRRGGKTLGLLRTVGELLHFLSQDRRGWFLLPIVVGLLALGALIALASATSLGPFIYTIF
jgi:hypothetical protein